MFDVMKSFFQVVFLDKASIRFAVGITLGFAFSISVILSTVGIMDGFEWSLKLRLKKSMGDLSVFSRGEYFNLKKDVLPNLKAIPGKTLTPILETQAFVVKGNISKGIVVKGIEEVLFSQITGLHLDFENSEIAIGKELARFLSAKVGDELVIAFSKGNGGVNDLPSLETFIVGQIIEHGIYQKDLRFIYIKKRYLEEILDLKGLSNSFTMMSLNSEKIDYKKNTDEYMIDIEQTADIVQQELGESFYTKPFWEDFTFLIRAVATEKYMIGLILQLVVVISIFNILAFVIYINEKRARELFLFQALGMSHKNIFSYLMIVVFTIWIVSCSLAIGLVSLFNFSLKSFSFFQLPGDIYTLGSLSINLDRLDYFVVFGIAFLWLFSMAWFGLARLRKKSILQGLRREFA